MVSCVAVWLVGVPPLVDVVVGVVLLGVLGPGPVGEKKKGDLVLVACGRLAVVGVDVAAMLDAPITVQSSGIIEADAR